VLKFHDYDVMHKYVHDHVNGELPLPCQDRY
jgi:hypothetical protein